MRLADHHRFCSHCGQDLHLPEKRRRAVRFLLIGLVALLTVGGVVFGRYLRQKDHAQPLSTGQIHPNGAGAPPADKQASASRKPQRPTLESPPFNAEKSIPFGTVIIADIAGDEILRMGVPILAEGWIALPRKLILGGYRWRIDLSGGETVPIEAGLLQERDRIGLWQIDSAMAFEGPVLAPWEPDKPVQWFSMETGGKSSAAALDHCIEEGDFEHCTLSGLADRYGLLFQGNSVVGWSFGDVVPGAFLWRGWGGSDLVANLRVADFYGLSFAGGREEALIAALAMHGASERERLAALADAFQREEMLAEPLRSKALPEERILAMMRNLVASLVQGGQVHEVTDLFDAGLLAGIEDVSLTLLVATAVHQGQGAMSAIELIEEVQLLTGQRPAPLEAFLEDLYIRQLGLLTRSGDWEGLDLLLTRAADALPDNPAIHLYHVTAAIAQEDWSTADQLLTARDYPMDLKDRVENLAHQIAALRETSQGILIRFPVNSRHIKTEALLNDNIGQQFIVDTGASMVTIPTSTARQLEIPAHQYSAKRKVNTAGGVVEAREVRLESITLDGYVVREVQALVLDLPNLPDMGLLGMNYLGRFEMDLDSHSGTLLLTPRW